MKDDITDLTALDTLDLERELEEVRLALLLRQHRASKEMRRPPIRGRAHVETSPSSGGDEPSPTPTR